MGMAITGRSIQKIWEFEAVLRGQPTRVVFGGAGRFETIQLIKEWLEQGHDPFNCFDTEQIVPEVDGKDFEGMLVTQGGQVFDLEDALIPLEAEAPKYMGSGGMFAAAFLDSGLNGIEAIRRTMNLDAGTGGQVRAFDTVEWRWVDPDTLK